MAGVTGQKALDQSGSRPHHAHHDNRLVDDLVFDLGVATTPILQAQSIPKVPHHRPAKNFCPAFMQGRLPERARQSLHGFAEIVVPEILQTIDRSGGLQQRMRLKILGKTTHPDSS
jgi:hypothetical protein